MMELSRFDYDLPKESIAQYPLKARDASRLLVVNRKEGTLEHRSFKDILAYLHQDDLLVLNNTKVLPARLLGHRATGGKVEVLLIERLAENRFKAFLKPGRLKSGEKVVFGSRGVLGVVCGKDEIAFPGYDPKRIYGLGLMPLPPYIKRETQDSDRFSYQTVYAKVPGAIASPTAGLHFTRTLLSRIKSRGVRIASVTLHVGVGTFRPVKAADITRHLMDREYFNVPENAQRQIKRTQGLGRMILAVGTTSLRALETYASGERSGYTNLFIYPGYEFKLVTSLLTNFHLPRTTLFMLVCAFAGERLVKKAYQEAVERKYRFYSYGDAMLIV